jgi:hypothetical protein
MRTVLELALLAAFITDLFYIRHLSKKIKDGIQYNAHLRRYLFNALGLNIKINEENNKLKYEIRKSCEESRDI